MILKLREMPSFFWLIAEKTYLIILTQLPEKANMLMFWIVLVTL
jgi:hypothetical protein